MKKSILAVAVLIGATSFAQEESYLPEADDWAIGIDATPFLNYAGNLIGGNDGNVAPTWNYLTTNQTISGKLMASEDMAYRAAIRLGFGSYGESGIMVADRNPNLTAPTYPALPAMVENSWKGGSTNIGLSGGIEYRRNHGRLVGFYGGELGISFSSTKASYTYGNALAGDPDIIAVDPTDDSMNGGANIMTDTYGNNARVTEFSSGTTMAIGLRGFIGVEYFVWPRIAFGGEFGWGLAMASNATNTTSIESVGFNGTANIVGTQEIEGFKASSFGVDTDAINTVFGPAGTLRMTFYF